MKKGQAAMEFLMTYGWAILVVLAAIAALAYFGVFNQSNFLPEACQFGPGFSCVHKVTPTDVQLRVTNGLGKDLTNFTVAISGCTSPAGQAMSDGATIDITLTDCDGNAWTVGSKVKADLTYSYSEVGGFDHSKTGKLVAQVE
ncbi:hypothetical protein JW968_01205 [Candidatus Woesearchaeota archaeon]|nr:hypothetical protein [Candidatus Woesearchaeota archaeon]